MGPIDPEVFIAGGLLDRMLIMVNPFVSFVDGKDYRRCTVRRFQDEDEPCCVP